MDLTDFRAIVAVAETGSFTRAANRLNISQPPLSRRIASIEARLDTLVFRRERPLELTQAGQFLYEQAKQVLARVDEIVVDTQKIAAARKQYFRIGLVGSTLYGALPLAIKKFRDSHEGVKVSLYELSTLQQREALLERRIDVGLGRLDFGDTAGLAREIIEREPLMVAVASAHKWAKRKQIRLEELLDVPLLIYPKSPRPSFADYVLSLFEPMEQTPSIEFEANDLQTTLGLVTADIGAAFVPKSVSKTRRQGISFVNLVGTDACSPIIASFQQHNPSPLIRIFLKLLRQS